jgi:protein-disulfide isomerase
VIFHHYPLDQECNPTLHSQIHATSCAAAIAAECAGEQGKFWEYADLLFADQSEYTRQELDDFAKKLNLDESRFVACQADSRAKDMIRQDIEDAERIGIKATPTLVVNGRLLDGGVPPLQKLASLITAEKQRTTK